jgi:rhodanese-related sulfurtransferase
MTKKRKRKSPAAKHRTLATPKSSAARQAQRQAKRRQQLILWGSIAATVILVIVALVFINSRTSARLPATISIDEAYQMYQAGAFLLDVRTQEEWDEFHIPGTTLIPLEELAGRVDEIPLDEEVVVICHTGNRSQEGRDILLQAGFKQVTSVDGGVNDWADSGYPIE